MAKPHFIVDRFPVYTSSTEVRKLLKAKSNDSQMVADDWGSIPFRLKLKRLSPTSTEVTYAFTGDEDMEMDVRAYLRSRLSQYLTPKADTAMAARIDALLALVPDNDFLAAMKEVALSGKGLKGAQITVIEDMEARAASPDESDISYIKGLLIQNPNNEFLKSVLGQAISGYELSDKQREALKRFEPTTDPLLEARIQAQLERAKSTFLESILSQLQAGRRLSPKQLEALKKIEEQGTGSDPIVARIERILSSIPSGNSFLESLLSQAKAGRRLSQRQIEALEAFESRMTTAPAVTAPAVKAPASSSRKMTPQEALLSDLILNANMPAREDSLMSGFLTRLRTGGEPLDENEKKAVRHLLYKNYKRLHKTDFGTDFKSYVRSVFG